METIFKLKATELDRSFIESVKSLFKDREIEISIKPTQDESDYLLNTSANRKQLMEAIKEIKNNKNLVHFSGKEFDEMSEKLLRE